MPDSWMPSAQRCDIGDHAPTDPAYPPRAIAHITWDRNASATAPKDLLPFSSLRSYFAGGGQGVAPHILWSPFTGEVTQFVPADSRSKSLVDLAGGTRTNRAGRVVIQIEALFFPYCQVDGKVYARLADTPCLGWDRLHAWVASWGVPDEWPNGRPEHPTRDEHTWETRGGWYPHAGVPENTHSDPLSWPAFPASAKPPVGATSGSAKPTVDLSNVIAAAKADPRAAQGHALHAADVKPVEAALKAEGLLAAAYAADGSFGSLTITAYAAWQRHLGYSGSDADGIPGKTSLTKLGQRHGFNVKD